MPTSLLGRNGEILYVYQSLQVCIIYHLSKNSFKSEENGMKMKTTDRSATYDGACQKAFFSLRTVSERAAKTIRFNTLWQWKGYVKIHIMLKNKCKPSNTKIFKKKITCTYIRTWCIIVEQKKYTLAFYTNSSIAS